MFPICLQFDEYSKICYNKASSEEGASTVRKKDGIDAKKEGKEKNKNQRKSKYLL
jgi:hypothetical protein